MVFERATAAPVISFSFHIEIWEVSRKKRIFDAETMLQSFSGSFPQILISNRNLNVFYEIEMAQKTFPPQSA